MEAPRPARLRRWCGPAWCTGGAGSALPLALIAGGKERGAGAYIGAGANLWSVVHVDDLARLYLAAVEHAERGLIVNAASRRQVSMRELSEAVADLTGARAVTLTPEQAHAALGPFAAVPARSAPIDPSRPESVLSWKPEGPALLDDLRTGSYAAPQDADRTQAGA